MATQAWTMYASVKIPFRTNGPRKNSRPSSIVQVFVQRVTGGRSSSGNDGANGVDKVAARLVDAGLPVVSTGLAVSLVPICIDDAS